MKILREKNQLDLLAGHTSTVTMWTSKRSSFCPLRRNLEVRDREF